MLSYGATHMANLAGTADDTKLLATYYDAQWVFYQIKDYTSDSSWQTGADRARAVYRDYYVVPNNGGVAGYWNFTHGLTEDYLRTGNTASRDAVYSIVDNGAYCSASTPLSSTVDFTLSREVAYAIMAYINAERCGRARNARLSDLTDQALGHLDQWFVSNTAPYIKSFMVGLTAHALITVYNLTGDSRVQGALTTACNELWNRNWDAVSQSFTYTKPAHLPDDPADPAPDLNLLICPLYAWVYQRTGNTTHRDRADTIFASGVANSYLTQPKIFNQNYRWAFEYVRIRKLV